MIDLKAYRLNPELFIKGTKDKHFDIDFLRFQELDSQLLKIKSHIENLQNQRNTLTKEIENIKKVWGNADELMQQVKTLKVELETAENTYAPLHEEFQWLYLRIPNPALPDVPYGESDEQNSEIAKVWNPRVFDFKPLTHRELLEKRNMLDSERAVKISGSRFVFVRNGLVQLELALVQWTMDKLANKGFSPTIVPTLVKKDAMYATGYLPYGEDQIYQVIDEDGSILYLVGTSEVPLVSQHMNETISVDQLPLRYVGFSPCYRKEAGTYGKDTKGLIRVHQFEKVEMVSFVRPEDSEKEHQLILAIEEEIFQELGIPYRKLDICTGDLGVPAAKKYDLEGRFPGLEMYKEITSCSNCTDFQSRRSNIKCKSDKDKDFLHILNGTVVAVGRTLAAIVENYQQQDLKVTIPEVLKPYMGGKDFI